MSFLFNVKGKRLQVDSLFKDSKAKEYRIIEELDGGGNSIVFKVSSNIDIDDEKNIYAMKVLKYNDKRSVESFEKEKDILKEFSSDVYRNNFVTLLSEGTISVSHVKKQGRKSYKTINTTDYQFFIMDLADKNIKDFLCANDFNDEKQVFPYIVQLAESLMLIHEKDYVHRDIKPQNILLQGDVPKIADFGLMVKEDACQRKIGPKYWPTPEFLELCNHDEHCAKKTTDIFQLGCIFFFLLTRQYPIGNVSINDMNPSYKLKPIIKKMLCYDKASRYSNGKEVYDAIKAI